MHATLLDYIYILLLYIILVIMSHVISKVMIQNTLVRWRQFTLQYEYLLDTRSVILILYCESQIAQFDQ